MSTYYLADPSTNWYLYTLNIPRNGSLNLSGGIFSGSSSNQNLSIGTAINTSITGTNNISFGPNNCSVITTGSNNIGIGTNTLNKITTLSRNISIGNQALGNLSLIASGLSSINVTSSGDYSYPLTSATFPINFIVAAGPTPTTLPQAYAVYSASSSSAYWSGIITAVVLTYSGTGFTGTTFFTLTIPGLAAYTRTAATFSLVYSSYNQGNDNIAIGHSALSTNYYSTFNMAIGNYALANLNQTTSTTDLINNIAIGYYSQNGSVQGSNNISLGNFSLGGSVGSSYNYAPTNVICIGNNAMANVTAGGTNSIIIGNNSNNAATGYNGALSSNICVGNSSLSVCVSGYNNVVLGNTSATKITSGYNNTILGNFCGNQINTGHDNIIVGYGTATISGATPLITGAYNVIMNFANLQTMTSASNNVLIGSSSANYLTTGRENVCIGSNACLAISSGSNNIGIGRSSMNSLTTGTYNIGIGDSAGQGIRSGINNICIGTSSGLQLFDGANQNVFIGLNAGFGSDVITSDNCVCIGTNSGYSLSTGNNNTFVGTSSTTASLTTTGSNVTTLGYNALPSAVGVSNEITLGNTSVLTLRCKVTSITSTSDIRDKTDISDLVEGLDFINQVRPVKFTWAMRPEYDESGNEIPNSNNGSICAGFIAQELDEVQTNANAYHLNLVMKNNPDRMEATYGYLIPVMVKAIKDLSVKVDNLTQQLEVLQKK